MELFARVAVKGIPFSADKPYDYRIPGTLGEVLPGMRVIVPFGAGNKRVEAIILSVGSEQRFDKVKNIHSILDNEPVLDDKQIKLALWMHKKFFCTVYEAVSAMLPAALSYMLEDNIALCEGVTRETAFETVGGDAYLLLTMLFAAGGRAMVSDCEIALNKNPARAIKTLRDKGIITGGVDASKRLKDLSEQCAALAVPPEEALSAVGSRAGAQREIVAMLCDVGSALVRDIRYITGAGTRSLKALEKKGIIWIYEVPVYKKKIAKYHEEAEEIHLNSEQQAAFDRCVMELESGKPSCGLLYGVTGSGKTSVYIRLIEHTLALGGQCLVLVPEISLTPQMLALFSAHFGDNVALMHSSLGMREKLGEWKRLREGKANVCVGTRSAVFSPFNNLRLLIIDEEQEGSYKSETSPRYHARQVAKFRCVQYGAVLLLGSATPSVESYHSAQNGQYFFTRLEKRYNKRELPPVRIISMRDELAQGNAGTISAALHGEITENLTRSEQTILLLNRRGHSIYLCPECGEGPGCPRCSVSLNYHSANGRLMCHYCGYSEKMNDKCPKCGVERRSAGAGTQKIAEDLVGLFGDIEILRMDTDTTSAKGSHEQMLERFRKRGIPILVGTQMVAKGLDFENVTLVGVLNADTALNMPDFRAHERAFSLITQVIGRAGRGNKPGRAIIQTFNPDSQVIQSASRQDYQCFYEGESALRRLQGYPPFGAITRLTLFGVDRSNVLKAGLRVKGLIDRTDIKGLRSLGPAPDRILRVNHVYRYHILLLGSNESDPRNLVDGILTAFPADRQNKGVNILADYDPLM